MKIFALLLGFLAVTSSSYGDAQCITVELFRDKPAQKTLVSITGFAHPAEDSQNVSIQEVAIALRSAVIRKGIVAVIHSEEFIPSADLKALVDALAASPIELEYIQVGQRPNWYKATLPQTP